MNHRDASVIRVEVWSADTLGEARRDSEGEFSEVFVSVWRWIVERMPHTLTMMVWLHILAAAAIIGLAFR